MKVSLKTSFGGKCGVEDLALLSVYPSPFGILYLGPVFPHWPNAPNRLKQELICEMVFTLDIFFNWFWLIDIFFYFLINRYAQIEKLITKQDWPLEILEWKLAKDHIRCKIWCWRLDNSLFVSKPIIWGIWVQFPQITQMLQIPLNNFNSTLTWHLHLTKTLGDTKCRVEDFGLLS